LLKKWNRYLGELYHQPLKPWLCIYEDDGGTNLYKRRKSKERRKENKRQGKGREIEKQRKSRVRGKEKERKRKGRGKEEE
jgi:hypothetical protein